MPRSVSLFIVHLLAKVAKQILLDLRRADFPDATIDEQVMNIDEGHKNPGTKRQGIAWKRVGAKEHKRTAHNKGEHIQNDVI